MKARLKYLLAMGLVITLGACSSSQESDEDGEEEDGMSEEMSSEDDAGTDAAPAASSDAPKSEEQASNAGDTQATPPPAEGEAAATSTASSDPATAPATDSTESASTAPAADPMASTGSGEMGSYTVSKGDTLMKIAFETYGDLYQWKKILDANKDKITDPNRIPAGTVLQVEKPAAPVSISRNGDQYLIKMGDTLGKISDDLYGTNRKWKKLWENNRELIKDPNRIFAGFYLYYSMTPEEKEEAEKLKGTKTSAPLADSGQQELPALSPMGDTASGNPFDPAPAAGGGSEAPREPAGKTGSGS